MSGKKKVLKTYGVKRHLVEEYEVEAYSLKEARQVLLEDPNKIIVIKETVKHVI